MIEKLLAPAPVYLQFDSRAGRHLLLSRHTRLFDLPPDGEFDAQAPAMIELFERLGQASDGEVSLDTWSAPTPQSVSLNISAGCNLACGYCYAGQGAFGGAQPKGMGWDIARKTVDRLIDGADPASPVTIGFLGGEPLVNRSLLHRVVNYAADAGVSRERDVRFSVTTNGTLLDEADRMLFRRHRFAVTVSLDGDQQSHDRNRPTKSGKGSWAQAVANVAPLLADPGRAQIAARVTVTRTDLDLKRQFVGLVAAGFSEIGFSPLRKSVRADDMIEGEAWVAYQAALIVVSKVELARLRSGLPIRLTNLAIALKNIHRGASSPYPCGAGGGYFSVAADGDWYACHRAIGQADYRMGDVDALDTVHREQFLRNRHVDAQTDCTTCWARYLCSGGCHQEVEKRTAQSCDFVRGWLTFCLQSYCELHLYDKEAANV